MDRACLHDKINSETFRGRKGGKGKGVIVHRGGRVQSANKKKVADRAESRIILCRALASSEMSRKSRSDNNSPPIFPTPLFNPVQHCQPLLPPPASIFSQCQANNATDIPNSAVPQLMGRWKRLFSCRLAASMSQPDRNDGNVSGEGQALSLNIPPDIKGPSGARPFRQTTRGRDFGILATAICLHFVPVISGQVSVNPVHRCTP